VKKETKVDLGRVQLVDNKSQGAEAQEKWDSKVLRLREMYGMDYQEYIDGNKRADTKAMWARKELTRTVDWTMRVQADRVMVHRADGKSMEKDV